MKRLIVTGDDFGLSLGVNDAIERAHRDGILNTTSLMIAEPAASDAVRRARALPTLNVGLHIALVRARPMLPPSEVPSLVDANGMFATNLTLAGMRFFFSRSARRQLDAEIRAQFEAFRATGLRLDHVNAHSHMHVHPTLLASILRIGRDYAVRAVRVPFEPFVSWRTVVVEPWARLLRSRLRKAGIAHNDFIFGIHNTGHMTTERVLTILRDLPDGVSEIYFHPDDSAAGRAELVALTDARVVAALADLGIEGVAFSDLVVANRA